MLKLSDKYIFVHWLSKLKTFNGDLQNKVFNKDKKAWKFKLISSSV